MQLGNRKSPNCLGRDHWIEKIQRCNEMDLRPSDNFWVIEWKMISLNKRWVVSRNQFSHALYLSVSSSLCEWPVATHLRAPIPISICICICIFICICICWSTSARWTKRWADGGDTNEARAHLFSRGELLHLLLSVLVQKHQRYWQKLPQAANKMTSILDTKKKGYIFGGLLNLCR